MSLPEVSELDAAPFAAPAATELALCLARQARLLLRARVALAFRFLPQVATAAVPRAFAERALFYRQREAGYFRTYTYFLAHVAHEAPVFGLEALLFSALAYWGAGFSPADAGARFGVFVAGCFLARVAADATLRVLCAWLPDARTAGAVGPATLLVFILFSGFLVPRDSIPRPWIFMHYLSPLSYPLEALAVNELRGTAAGAPVLALFGYPDEPSAVSRSLGIAAAFCVALYALAAALLDRRRPRPSRPRAPRPASSAQKAPLIMTNRSLRGGPLQSPAAAWADEPAGLELSSASFSSTNSKLNSKLPAAAEVVVDPEAGVAVPRAGGEEEEEEGALAIRTGPAATPGHLAFADLSYSVPAKGGAGGERALLTGVSGFVRPGEMLALMGPSGGGKTTLLDVLAGRKTGGKISGGVLLNGRERDASFRRLTGYVEQFDLLLETQTVREAVQFCALTRLPASLPRRYKLAAAEGALKELQLAGQASLPLSAASFELRKRATIAMELVCGPAVLFLDEPTTGLDAPAAANIVRCLRRLCRTRRVAVVCTVHQPSAELFCSFDSLLLLQRGGRVAYFGGVGPAARRPLAHFEALCGEECAPGRNPADFLLEVVQGKRGAGAGDCAAAFAASPLAAAAAAELDAAAVEAAARAPGGDRQAPLGPHAVPATTQLRECAARAYRSLRRRPAVLRALLLRSLLVAAVMGTLFFSAREEGPNAPRTRTALLFTALTYLALGALGSIPGRVEERAVFYREAAQGSVRPAPQALAWLAAEAPLSAACTLLFSLVLYFAAGLDPARLPFFLLVMVVFAWEMDAMMGLFAAACPSAEAAGVLAPTAIAALCAFAGFLVPEGSMPAPWRWAYRASPWSYALEALAAPELAALGAPGGAALAALGLRTDAAWQNVAVGAAFAVAFRAAECLALAQLRHLKR
eukprot:tig00000402_g190.t1